MAGKRPRAFADALEMANIGVQINLAHAHDVRSRGTRDAGANPVGALVVPWGQEQPAG
jgi:hypothetical protein